VIRLRRVVVRLGCRVLVVDDDEVTRRVLDTVLDLDEFDVLTAADGEAALELARSGQPDVVLLDVMMPGIDGLEVCRRLKADALTAGIPVILLSALDRAEHVRAGEDAGCAAYLTKPFSPRELIHRIMRVSTGNGG
jgi:two-component system, cell cycle response regulator